MKKNVVSIVINNFINDNRVLKEAISLNKNNYKITIVAVHEKNLNEFDQISGINVHRMKLLTRNWPRNIFIKLLKFFEFTFRVAFKYKNNDFIHCNDLDALVIGVLIKKIFNKKTKVIYDAHEYETERNGYSKRNKYFLKIIETYLIKYVDETITVSNSIANEYVKLYNIDKPKLVLNCPEKEIPLLKDLFRKEFNIPKDKTIFLYQGSLGKNRGVEVLLDVFKNICDNKKVIVFMGYGALVEEIKKEVKFNKNIFYHPAVNKDVLINYTSSADIGVSLIENTCLSHYYCLPNKMFEYMMAEIPIIVSNLPEMSNLINTHKIGYVSNGDDKQSLLNIINNISEKDLASFKINLKKIKDNYSWEEQEKKLLEVYQIQGKSND